MSIAGGLHLALRRAREVEANVVQIFVKNERQWRGKAIADEDATQFRRSFQENAIRCAFAHDTYLINLATSNKELWEKSLDAFREELDRCEKLGLSFLVTHPGSPGDAGEDAGIKNMIRALNELHRQMPKACTRILLETTAGQGATVGWRFEQMRAILSGLRNPDRIAFCFDTCHVFAAGYDLRTPAGYECTMNEFDSLLGLDRIGAFHLNDSKKGLGCRVDRHEHIGRGEIGLGMFRCLMNDPRFHDVPMVLETPKENDMDRKNLELLRSLRR